MKILVVQNKMGIGDMIIYLPFIDAISKKFNTPVSILAKQSSKAEQFLKDHKNIKEIIMRFCAAAQLLFVCLQAVKVDQINDTEELDLDQINATEELSLA